MPTRTHPRLLTEKSMFSGLGAICRQLPLTRAEIWLYSDIPLPGSGIQVMAATTPGRVKMAHQSTTIPTRNTRNEPISWPTTEGTMPRAFSVRKPATAQVVYRSSLAAAQSSLRAAQRKASGIADSVTNNLRRFADERPLYFVGAVAGVAFVAGMGLRIWRSTRHA